MTVEQDLVRFAKAYQTQLLRIRDASATAVGAIWDRFMTGPDDRAAGEFVRLAAQAVTASQSAAVSSTVAYIPGYVAVATSTPVVPVAVDVAEFLAPRAGVVTAEVLDRAVVKFRTDLSNRVPFLDARAAGRARAVQTAATEPVLSARAAGSELMKAEQRIVGFRRVPDSGACSFCRLAATQRYRDGDLMPLHPGCGCAVAPIVGDRDPGQVIDRENLARLKADGVIDEISYRRRISSAEEIAEGYEAKAAEWRRKAAETTDQQAETRYAKRADTWAARAKGRRAEIDADKATLKAIQSKRYDRLTAVHDHGELGPTLYPAATNFATV